MRTRDGQSLPTRRRNAINGVASMLRCTFSRCAARWVGWMCLGIVVSMGLAWIVWLWYEPMEVSNRLAQMRSEVASKTATLHFDGRRNSAYRWRVPAIRQWCIDVPNNWPSTPDYATCEAGLGWTRVSLGAKRITAGHVRDDIYSCDRAEYGLPWRCVKQSGYMFVPESGNGYACSGPMPALPVFPGCVLDPVFWGGFGLIVTRTWRGIRRQQRRRRGACENCGYTRSTTATDTPCPECGIL